MFYIHLISLELSILAPSSKVTSILSDYPDTTKVGKSPDQSYRVLLIANSVLGVAYNQSEKPSWTNHLITYFTVLLYLSV